MYRDRSWSLALVLVRRLLPPEFALNMSGPACSLRFGLKAVIVASPEPDHAWRETVAINNEAAIGPALCDQLEQVNAVFRLGLSCIFLVVAGDRRVRSRLALLGTSGRSRHMHSAGLRVVPLSRCRPSRRRCGFQSARTTIR